VRRLPRRSPEFSQIGLSHLCFFPSPPASSFPATSSPRLAVAHFEAALAVVKIEGQRMATEKKLAAANDAAASQQAATNLAILRD
jgi:hypothetical protein